MNINTKTWKAYNKYVDELNEHITMENDNSIALHDEKTRLRRYTEEMDQVVNAKWGWFRQMFASPSVKTHNFEASLPLKPLIQPTIEGCLDWMVEREKKDE